MKFREFLKEDSAESWFDSFEVTFMQGPNKEINVKTYEQMSGVIQELNETGKFTDPVTNLKHFASKIIVFANKAATFSWPFDIKSEVMDDIITFRVGDTSDPKIIVKNFKEFPENVCNIELRHCVVESFDGVKGLRQLAYVKLELSTFKNIIGFIDANAHANFYCYDDTLSQPEQDKLASLMFAIEKAQKEKMDKAEFTELLHDEDLEEFI